MGLKRVRDGLWSPDGTAVAFVRPASTTRSPTTVSVMHEGRAVRITPSRPGFRWVPLAWSPDSSRLALARYAIPPPTRPGQEIPPSSASLWVTAGPIAQSRLRRLPTPTVSPGHPGWPDIAVWSPNGRFLTVGVGPAMPCESCRADGRPYEAIPVDGGEVTRLGTALSPDESISWAPDGSYLILSSPAGRETYADKHLVRSNPAAGTRRALSRARDGTDTEPAVSPDGKQVAFARGNAAGPVISATPLALITSRHVWLMDAGGAHSHRLTAASGWTDEAPVWSPNGRWIVFVRWRRHEHGHAAEAALWAARVDGTATLRLAPLDLPAGFLNGFGYYGAIGWKDLFAVAGKTR